MSQPSISSRSSDDAGDTRAAHRARRVIETARDVIYTLLPDGRIASLNPVFEAITGWSKDEWIDRPFASLVHPDDLPQALEKFQRVLRSETPPVCELRIRTKGGEYRVGEFFETAEIEDGVVVAVLGIGRDITDRKRIEHALRESEQRYRSLVANLKEVVFQTDAEGRWLFLNAAWSEITGFSVEESLGVSFLDYVHPDDRQRNLELFQPLIDRTKDSCQHEIRYLTKDGGVRWIEVHARLTLDDQGAILGTSGTLRDITTAREASVRLEARERQLAEAQQLAHLGTWEWDPASDRVVWSDEVYRIYGLPIGEPVTYARFLQFVQEEDRPRIEAAIAEARTTQRSFEFFHGIRRPNGQERILHGRGEVVMGPDGRVLRMHGTAQDVTELKQAEDRLRQAHAELERRVTERTAELAEANRALQEKILDLEKFEEVVVGRELKMMQLERENAALLRELERLKSRVP